MSKFIIRLCKGCVIILPIISFAQIWVARYNGPGNGWDGGNAISVDSAGNVYVAGSSDGVGSLYDYAVIKYSPSGVEQWVARYNGPGNGSDEAGAITIDGVGNIFITGFSEGLGTGADYATIKYNPSGVQQWVARYNGPGNMADGAGGIALDNAGNVYVIGFSVGSGTESDCALIKYDSTGVEQWVARYNSPDSSYDRAIALVLDDAGAIYVTGASQGPATGDDYVTIKYNSSGVEQWVARYNGPANGPDGADGIALDDMGNVYVTGSSRGLDTDNDYATVKYDSLGVEQWVVRYNGPANHWDDASAIAVDYLGNIYVTGRSVDSNLEDDYVTIKYNSSGVEQWVARYDGPVGSYDDARAIVVDNAGNIYVTGNSIGAGTRADYATVKYNAAGVEQWVVRYNGPINNWDDALAVAVDNAGYVYVTGWSRGLEIGFDFATIKYSCTGVEEQETAEERVHVRLTTFPNPFSKLTTISFGIVESANLRLSDTPERVEMKIYDATGKLVKEFRLTPDALRLTQITWDGTDQANRQLPNGVYLLKYQAGDYSVTEKLLLIK